MGKLKMKRRGTSEWFFFFHIEKPNKEMDNLLMVVLFLLVF